MPELTRRTVFESIDQAMPRRGAKSPLGEWKVCEKGSLKFGSPGGPENLS